MSAVEEFQPGGYRFIPGGFQFSGGVAASAGYEIKRCRFRAPAPLMEGFARIEAVIRAVGRPLTAFCACELRSPGQFTEQGFRAFNESYVVTLGKWGVYGGKVNPVARSNVCPEIDPPAQPGFHAFSFTAPAATGAAPSFVISGSAEARAIDTSYPERIIRGHVASVQPGSGTAFSLLPAQNATGNFVKIVQRVPVKVIIDNPPSDVALGPGMSVVPTVRVDPAPSVYERLASRYAQLRARL